MTVQEDPRFIEWRMLCRKIVNQKVYGFEYTELVKHIVAFNFKILISSFVANYIMQMLKIIIYRVFQKKLYHFFT